MPTTGEPEDIINEVPLLSDVAGVGPYYQIIPLNESEYPGERLPNIRCQGCQRVDVKYVYPLPENSDGIGHVERARHFLHRQYTVYCRHGSRKRGTRPVSSHEREYHRRDLR